MWSLPTPDRRRGLADEATGIAQLDREDRLAAVEAIARMSGGRLLTPEQLDRAVQEEREAVLLDR